MTSTDLDPIFVKALKLLQSRSKDSYFHLKQMYDEVVAQRRYDAAVKRVTVCKLYLHVHIHHSFNHMLSFCVSVE